MTDFKGLFAPFKISLIMLLGGVGTQLSAKEPTNWLFGFGIGAGKSQIDEKYTESARNGVGGLLNGDKTTFVNRYDSSAASWGVTYEFLVGYKHFLNDFVGFRYYGNIGI